MEIELDKRVRIVSEEAAAREGVEMGTTNETLTSTYADPDPLFGPIAAWEIGRRLQKAPKSTRMATRFLLPRDETDHADAFDGLVAMCWRAKGNLYIRRDDERTIFRPSLNPSGKKSATKFRPDESLHAVTRKFIILSVLELLAAYREKSPVEILTAALSGEFRHIPCKIKNKMSDDIRRWMAAKRHAVLLDLDHELDEDEEGGRRTNEDMLEARDDNSSVLGQIVPLARHRTPEELNDLFQADRNAWVDLVGEAGWEVIFASVNMYGQDAAADGTQREWDRLLTQEIARRRDVSLEQARSDRRKVQMLLKSAIRHRLVEKLLELFAPAADRSRNIPQHGNGCGPQW